MPVPSPSMQGIKENHSNGGREDYNGHSLIHEEFIAWLVCTPCKLGQHDIPYKDYFTPRCYWTRPCKNSIHG